MKIVKEVDANDWGEYDFVMGCEEDRKKAAHVASEMGYMVGGGHKGDFRVTINTEPLGKIPDHISRIRKAIETETVL
jgi:hypothetical protein